MNSRVLIHIIPLISAVFSFMPFIIASINLKKTKTFLIPLFILFAINIVMELFAIVLSESGENNQYIFHYFTVVEFTLISLFYSFFFKNYFSTLLINLLIPVFLLAAYIDYKVNGLESMDNFSTSIESIVLIFYSLFFFYYVLKNLIFENLLQTPVFWINTAILFYFSGNLILFIFSNYMGRIDPVKYAVLWVAIHSFFNVLYSILLSIGFWKTRVR